MGLRRILIKLKIHLSARLVILGRAQVFAEQKTTCMNLIVADIADLAKDVTGISIAQLFRPRYLGLGYHNKWQPTNDVQESPFLTAI